MKKLLSLCAVGSISVLVSACTAPDRCIEDLDCGVGAYSEERTYRDYDLEPMKKSPVKPMPAVQAAPVMEEKAVVIEEKAPMEEPVQGTADAMFDERLTK